SGMPATVPVTLLGVPIEPPQSPWAFQPALMGPGDADGDLVGIGADLQPGTLLAAYRSGAFPMPVDVPVPGPDPQGSRRVLAWWSLRGRHRRVVRRREHVPPSHGRVEGGAGGPGRHAEGGRSLAGRRAVGHAPPPQPGCRGGQPPSLPGTPGRGPGPTAASRV